MIQKYGEIYVSQGLKDIEWFDTEEEKGKNLAIVKKRKRDEALIERARKKIISDKKKEEQEEKKAAEKALKRIDSLAALLVSNN